MRFVVEVSVARRGDGAWETVFDLVNPGRDTPISPKDIRNITILPREDYLERERKKEA